LWRQSATLHIRHALASNDFHSAKSRLSPATSQSGKRDSSHERVSARPFNGCQSGPPAHDLISSFSTPPGTWGLRLVRAACFWRKIEIGDASQVREKSVVFYPATRTALGRSLAAQFGCPAVMVKKGDALVVVLGRDVRNLTAIQRRG
jgi:hypothetical protein